MPLASDFLASERGHILGKITNELIQHCVAKKGAYKDYPFGADVVVIKVKKRIFAQFFTLDGTECLTFNGDIPTGEFYRAAYPELISRGYHCPPVQQPYFSTVKLNGDIPLEELFAMLDGSYTYVVGKLPKNQQEGLLNQ